MPLGVKCQVSLELHVKVKKNTIHWKVASLYGQMKLEPRSDWISLRDWIQIFSDKHSWPFDIGGLHTYLREPSLK